MPVCSALASTTITSLSIRQWSASYLNKLTTEGRGLFYVYIQEKETTIHTEALDLHPIIHVSECLLDYQRKLSANEVNSLDELQEVQIAFGKVLEENAALKEELNSFHELFEPSATLPASLPMSRRESLPLFRLHRSVSAV